MKALVAVLMGSDSDAPAMAGCTRVLEEYGIPYEARVLSAHRTPDATARYVRAAEGRGLRVIVAGAGGAAHLAGAMAVGIRLDHGNYPGRIGGTLTGQRADNRTKVGFERREIDAGGRRSDHSVK